MNLVDVVPAVAQQRIVAGAPATLEVFFVDQNGEPTSPTGPVTVSAKKADGTTAISSSTATIDSGVEGRVTKPLDSAHTAQLDLLTVTWSDTAGGQTLTTLVEIVGGVYFTVAEARAQIKTLTEDKYSTARVIDGRREVETEFERICGGAFVPRYRRIRIDSAGSTCLQLPDPLVRAVREVSPPGAATFDSGELAAITTSISGELAQTDPFSWFAQGIVAYEHGLDRPPQAVKDMSFVRLREIMNVDNAGIDSRVSSYTVNGETFTLTAPNERSTGNTTIDAVLAGYDFRELMG